MASGIDKATPQVHVGELIDAWAQAIRDKDLERTMAIYAPQVVASDPDTGKACTEFQS
ncbi:MAG: hypothetical protein WD534_14420 [Phycisphaeraceae bacterium]